MKKLALSLSLLVVLSSCSGGSSQSGTQSVPGKGAVGIQVIPNPIVATRVSGDMYDFPFEVVVRETGGHPIEVTRVSATVNGPGGLTFARESWDAERIRSMGYGTAVPANGELRYRFTPRREVPDERLFGGVSADLTVEAVDASSANTSASTTVTVTR
jgi:hypothetical protein